MSDTDRHQTLLRYTAQIVAAHARNHAVPAADLPGLIRQVHAALLTAGQAPAPSARSERPATTTVRTIFPDYIVCLEDGRKMKTLKRHLRSEYNLSPEQYREKWGLPPDYPMVAPNYAERRSELAREAGLGRRRAEATEAAGAAATAPQPAASQVSAGAETVAEAAPTPEPFVAPTPRAPEPTAASVFARFPTAGMAEDEPQPEPTPASPEAAGRKPARKPFAKQFARTMRR